MQPWMLLQFALALAAAVSCFALIIGEMHVIERAEEQELWRQLEEVIEKIR